MTAGTPVNSACHVGLTLNIHTSLHGLSFAAVSAKVLLYDNPDRQLNSPAPDSKLTNTLVPLFVSIPLVSTDSPVSNGTSSVNPPFSGASHSTVVCSDQSKSSANSRRTRTYGGNCAVACDASAS